jgi:hypothetical protein
MLWLAQALLNNIRLLSILVKDKYSSLFGHSNEEKSFWKTQEVLII